MYSYLFRIDKKNSVVTIELNLERLIMKKENKISISVSLSYKNQKKNQKEN
jgi:hypothetical protein